MDVAALEHYPTQWRKIRQERIWQSRITGGAVKNWFDDSIERDCVFDVQSLKQMIFTWLKSCEARSGSTGIKMKGSMIRPFPTTLACTVAYKQRNRIVTKHIWAGDSRTFFPDTKRAATNIRR